MSIGVGTRPDVAERNQRPRPEVAERNRTRIKHGMARKGKTPEYRMFMNAKHTANAQGLPFNIELSDIVIPEFCPVFKDVRLVKNNTVHQYNSPSIDKLVPEFGYVKGNVRVISFRANTIKQDATAAELRTVAAWLDKELHTC